MPGAVSAPAPSTLRDDQLLAVIDQVAELCAALENFLLLLLTTA